MIGKLRDRFFWYSIFWPIMTPRFSTFFYYLIIVLSFYDVFAIERSCDSRASLHDLKSHREKLLTAGELIDRSSYLEIDPTSVNVSLTINDLNILDVRTMDLEIDLEMTQRWYDGRLGPDYRTQKLAVLGAIWQPKITFVIGNTCSKKFFDSDQTQFWRGTSNGSVLYSERYSVKPKCTNNLAKYPFDVQTCFLKVGSYRFTAEELSLSWTSSEASIETWEKKELGEFRIRRIYTRDKIDVRSAGNFSVLVVEIQLERFIHREVMRSVLPSFLLVKIACTVFWIKLSAIRERIFTCQFSLFGTLFLFVNSNYYHQTETGNGVNYYLKALDIWFLVCLILILIPLIESILITNQLNRDENFGLCCSEIELESECRTVTSGRKWAIYVEKIFRFLHPAASLFCAVLFFTIFNENHDDDD